MKILLVNKFFFPHGGAETVFFQEKEMLSSEGLELIDFSMQHEKNVHSEQNKYFVENVDYDNGQYSLFHRLKVSLNFIHNRQACKNIAKLIEREQPDIVHFHNVYHQITPSVIKVCKQYGCKTVLTAHDYKVACPSYSFLVNGKIFDIEKLEGSLFKVFLYQWHDGSWPKSILISVEAFYHSLKRSYSYVDTFIAPSEFMASMIRRRQKNSNVRVLVNGIDTDLYKSSDEDEGYFLFLGRLSPEKGIETLVKAHQAMKTSCALKILGNGPLLEYLKEGYPSAEVLGFKQGAELSSIVSGARAIVVPSEWYENCSMSVLEAMAHGKAVIGANSGGIPEQVRDGVEGLIFEAGNTTELTQKMDLLASNPELARELGANARARVETKYSSHTHKQALIDLYAELVSS